MKKYTKEENTKNTIGLIVFLFIETFVMWFVTLDEGEPQVVVEPVLSEQALDLLLKTQKYLKE